MEKVKEGVKRSGAGRPPSVMLPGAKFGRWTVIGPALQSGRAMWNCVCVCGSRRAVSGTELRLGRSKSCGCLARGLSRHRMKMRSLLRVR